MRTLILALALTAAAFPVFPQPAPQSRSEARGVDEMQAGRYPEVLKRN